MFIYFVSFCPNFILYALSFCIAFGLIRVIIDSLTGDSNQENINAVNNNDKAVSPTLENAPR